MTHAKRLVNQFHKKHPNAPKRISTASFAALIPLLRPPTVNTDLQTLAAIYPDIIDLEWEDGKYQG